MKVDIKEVFIYSDNFFYDYSNDRKYEYVDFIREMNALCSPKTMYQDSFMYEKLMASGIVTGRKSKVIDAIILVPYKFSKKRLQDISFLCISMKYHQMIYGSMLVAVSAKKHPSLIVTDFGDCIEYMVCIDHEMKSCEYSESFSSGLVDEMILRAGTLDDVETICVSENLLSENFDKHYTYGQISEYVKVHVSESGVSFEEKV
ncbi:hypothetical protein EZV73_07520 [Acidaminobacter sp. JC074]|uniref:hypothetical protein n=1 Tax=Acidaminobacter sp. JC074 TaxID=2530199 RepID=UPI001F0E1C47|nr:hypothetical protein [Acidaminobacter sp. JC074]MCH4887414.1 hypothetical protein [Acidaminobacter sp. JC074]